MKKSILFFALLCWAAAAQAQTHTLGLRLSYFTGRYDYPSESVYANGNWTAQPQGLEPALQYRVSMGSTPLYVQTELSYYFRRVEGTEFDGQFPEARVTLKGSQALLLLPLIVGARLGRGKLQGFAAGGLSIGFFVREDWETVLYYDTEAKMETNDGEYGFVLEGGLNYSLSKHFEVALGCRYYAVQHSTKILSVYGATNSSWFVKRVMPGLSMGYKF